MMKQGLVLAGLFSFLLGGTQAEPAPVVIELFTSQGCSSCPSADRYLLEVGQEDGVIALAFHVDYWDYIGWEDPFAKSQWSQRQRSYSRAWKTGRVYTPQLVVNGKTHVVGSNRAAVQREIEAARKSPARAWVEASLDDDAVTIQAKSKHELDVMLAIYETNLTTAVASGENSGRKLKEGYVVRSLSKVGTLNKELATTHDLELDPSWKRSNTGAVVFLQDPTTREIFTATRIRL